jgi:curved DNA-binding protein CbpA
MKTLYDLLGIERNATHVEIERGYRRSLDAYLANKGTGQPDQETRRMQAAREAYLLLSTPTRRQVYDEQLRESMAARHMREHVPGVRRVSVALICTLLLGPGGGAYYFYKVQHDKTRQAPARGVGMVAVKPGSQALVEEKIKQAKEKPGRDLRAVDPRRQETGQASSEDQHSTAPAQQIVARAE